MCVRWLLGMQRIGLLRNAHGNRNDGGTMTDQPEDIVLPCSCHITHSVIDGVNVMQIAECRRGCGVVEDARNLTRILGKTLEVRRGT